MLVRSCGVRPSASVARAKPVRAARQVSVSRSRSYSTAGPSLAAARAALPSTAAGWTAYIDAQLQKLPDDANSAPKRQRLQEARAYIAENPQIVAERTEEIRRAALPAWDDKPTPIEEIQKRVHARAQELMKQSPVYKVMRAQDEIGLLQSLDFSSPSPTLQADIKSLEAKRDALIDSFLADTKLSASDRSLLERLKARLVAYKADLAPTAADREDRMKREEKARSAEQQLLDAVLKTPAEKEQYRQILAEKKAEYARLYDPKTTLHKLLYN